MRRYLVPRTGLNQTRLFPIMKCLSFSRHSSSNYVKNADIHHDGLGLRESRAKRHGTEESPVVRAARAAALRCCRRRRVRETNAPGKGWTRFMPLTSPTASQRTASNASRHDLYRTDSRFIPIVPNFTHRASLTTPTRRHPAVGPNSVQTVIQSKSQSRDRDNCTSTVLYYR
jgi:hypothetical protein